MSEPEKHNEHVDDWVKLQHKTMSRWINSKIEDEVTDLQKDLADGLVLVKLINKIVSEISDNDPHTKFYYLQPVYKKPTFKLQKYENVNDFLQFAKIVLKMNICNISADNIIEGNLKLILGLIWSIFIFSTTYSFSSYNNCNSFHQIKSILLEWVNSIIHKKGLPVITNFDRDWSLEINRPDLIFFSILGYYLPMKFPIESHSKKLKNLTQVFEISDSLGIPKLADIDDFLLFVPDEKCVVTYVLEWFKIFQMDNKYEDLKQEFVEKEVKILENVEGEKQTIDKEVNGHQQHISIKEERVLEENMTGRIMLDNFVKLIVDTVKLKYRYEAKALSFCNKVNLMYTKLNRDLCYFNNFSITTTIQLLKECFTLFMEAYSTKSSDFLEILEKFIIKTINIKIKFKILIKNLQEFENYRSDLKPQLTYNDFPELEKLYNMISDNLISIGINSPYEPPENLYLKGCLQKLTELTENKEKYFINYAKRAIHELQSSHLKDINNYLKIVEKNLNECKNTDNSERNSIIQSLDIVDYFIGVSHELDYFARSLNISRSTSGLKSLLESSIVRKHKSVESNSMLYQSFKNIISQNKPVVSSCELDAFLNDAISSRTSPTIVSSFINLIPSHTISCGSGFDISYMSDESDDNNSLFDERSRTKIYDDTVYEVADFCSKIDNGFQF